jgi:hypothetical protein
VFRVLSTNKTRSKKLPPGELEELWQKNPSDENGRRRYKHHQFLTKEIGNVHLEKHLAVVTTLMKISPNWRVFQSHFARAFPDAATQLNLELFEDDEN